MQQITLAVINVLRCKISRAQIGNCSKPYNVHAVTGKLPICHMYGKEKKKIMKILFSRSNVMLHSTQIPSFSCMPILFSGDCREFFFRSKAEIPFQPMGKEENQKIVILRKKKRVKILVVRCVLAATANNKYHVVNQRFE